VGLDLIGNILDLSSLMNLISEFSLHTERSTLSFTFNEHTIAVLKVFGGISFNFPGSSKNVAIYFLILCSLFNAGLSDRRHASVVLCREHTGAPRNAGGY
jgi:hypothetical protein